LTAAPCFFGIQWILSKISNARTFYPSKYNKHAVQTLPHQYDRKRHGSSHLAGLSQRFDLCEHCNAVGELAMLERATRWFAPLLMLLWSKSFK
jgi:hypothetical protein